MKPQICFFLSLCAVSSFLLCGAAAPKSEEKMMADATYVFTGAIEHVYSRNRIVDEGGFGQFEHTYYISEVAIDTIIKGDALKKGEVLYLNSYKVKWLGHGIPPPGHEGHYSTPETKKSYKFYVSKDDKNRLKIIFPNGMSLIE